MKEVKKFILVLFLVSFFKIAGGILCNSYSMLASGFFDGLLVLVSFPVYKIKENKKNKGIISSLIGFLMIIGGIGLFLFSTLVNVRKISFFVLIFLFLTLFIKYFLSCYYTSINLQKKKGILSYGNLSSTVDFVIYGIMFVSFVLSKLAKWISILKYVDILGMLLIAIFIIIKGVKVIVNSFRYMENNSKEVTDDYKNEIIKRNEVKELINLKTSSFGGINYIQCDLLLKENVTMIDANTFVVTLQDYLLKIADVVVVNLVEKSKIKNKKRPRVRSKKENARDSRSRNSKTNSKRKNSKKENKKS